MKILDRLSELYRRADRGPWKHNTTYSHDGYAVILYSQDGKMFESELFVNDETCQLITESRNALPALIEVARAAQEVSKLICTCGPVPELCPCCNLHSKLEKLESLANLEAICPEKPGDT